MARLFGLTFVLRRGADFHPLVRYVHFACLSGNAPRRLPAGTNVDTSRTNLRMNISCNSGAMPGGSRKEDVLFGVTFGG